MFLVVERSPGTMMTGMITVTGAVVAAMVEEVMEEPMGATVVDDSTMAMDMQEAVDTMITMDIQEAVVDTTTTTMMIIILAVDDTAVEEPMDVVDTACSEEGTEACTMTMMMITGAWATQG